MRYLLQRPITGIVKLWLMLVQPAKMCIAKNLLAIQLLNVLQWSLHKKLFAKEMDNLDFPAMAKNTYGISVVEYVNQFFKDKAKDGKYLAEMKSRLALRSDQVVSLNNILDETRTRFHEVHARMQPELDTIREQQVNKIRTMLDDTQRAEYEKMRSERLKNQGSRGGPGI